ncbi:helix-turn-helix domain-containing protein [Streptacidiphilus fuscans]|uniref:Helix-turn-helix domain-containing protein n=1 Tax=Streptacidiphilus fuscans TaxID=2789292 RepID=A0A931B4P7_9ACTN|nr:helix-turn-helix domain-containing protein [Streptacidiphilus fuscans]MBF9070243.1 helix-turn-helix domain-containing protein [Streptacidiphilus fuscans]
MSGEQHPLAIAIKPLLDAVGGSAVEVAEARPDDVLLEWDGSPAVAVRLPGLESALDRLLADVKRQFGGGELSELDRAGKQRVVALLEERGAFTVRHGVETVAAALGVSRFTVYNYLNRQQANGKQD